ncbi:MAG: 50S ribosomal protein L17 [Firmicutes bacterium]|nr:50S ribosomal protein L17 [Bacillota bacterium]
MPGYRKLGRPSAHRKSMLRNLVTDLLREGRIQTTEMRAKEARREAEKLITLAKNTTGETNVKNRRQAMEFIFDESVVSKLFDEIGPKYADRQGGYTRILKLGPRRGDAAEVVFLELV